MSFQDVVRDYFYLAHLPRRERAEACLIDRYRNRASPRLLRRYQELLKIGEDRMIAEFNRPSKFGEYVRKQAEALRCK